MTTMYSFSGETTVLIMSLAQVNSLNSNCSLALSVQVVVASLALGLSLLFFLCKLGRRYVCCCFYHCCCFSSVSCRVLYVFSNVVIIIGYIITYPFPFSSNPMKPFNGGNREISPSTINETSETTRTGCNPLDYSWCDRQLVKIDNYQETKLYQSRPSTLSHS